MDQETQARVEQIETELKWIDVQISELRREQERIMRRDPEYAEYLERFVDAAGGFYSAPLSIREYYQSVARLRELNDQLAAAVRESETAGKDVLTAALRKHGEELVTLESMLGV